MSPASMRHVWKDAARALCLILLPLLLAGCTTIRLVPAYDEQIDRGLTELYADTSAFVDRMIPISGTQEGAYSANHSFYNDASARVEALIARAEAHRVLSNCPSTAIMTRALDAARIPADVRGQIGTLPQGDCQVVLFRLIKGGFEDMRRFHEAQGDRGIPPSARGPLLDGGVGALLRAGITVEIAKRSE